MGTSKGYEAPTTPQWGNFKGDITRQARDGRPSNNKAQDIIQDYIRTNGGSQNISRGQGDLGGRSALNVSRNLGHFISSVNQLGFREAFKQLHLGNLEGKNVFEVTNELIDYLGGPSNTIDDVDARNALSRLIGEMTEDVTEDIDDINDIFDQTFNRDDVQNILSKFFAYYLYEQFCRVFYERLVTKVGENQAESFLSGINDYLVSRMEFLQMDMDLTNVDWTGFEGKQLVSKILEQTFYIFGGD